MIIACSEIGMKLDIEKGKGKVVLIENAWVAKFLVSDLYEQLRGEGEALVFYENNKEVEFGKKGEVIINPFVLDFNNRRIQTKLIAEAKELTEEYCRSCFDEVKKTTMEYMDKLSERIPYHVTYKDEFEIQSILKLLEIQLDYQEDSLEGRLISYIKIMNQLCGIDVFVFINLSLYISGDDYSELRKSLDYLEVFILFIEIAVQNNLGKALIIDKDLCMIEG